MRWLVAVFLIAHGALNLLIWGLPTPSDAPFDVHKSPIFGEVRVASTLIAATAEVLLIVAGITYLTDAGWWWVAAMAGACLSAAVMVLTFTPWWLFGLVINSAIVALTLRAGTRGDS